MRTLPRHKAIERLNNAQPKKKTTIERANSNIAAGTDKGITTTKVPAPLLILDYFSQIYNIWGKWIMNII